MRWNISFWNHDGKRASLRFGRGASYLIDNQGNRYAVANTSGQLLDGTIAPGEKRNGRIDFPPIQDEASTFTLHLERYTYGVQHAQFEPVTITLQR
jgi:hypothetical protein